MALCRFSYARRGHHIGNGVSTFFLYVAFFGHGMVFYWYRKEGMAGACNENIVSYFDGVWMNDHAAARPTKLIMTGDERREGQ